MSGEIKNPRQEQEINGVVYKFIDTPIHPDFLALCKKLDYVLGIPKSSETWTFDHAKHIRHNAKDVENLWIAYVDGVAVGCAGFRWHGRRVAEVRRVFVDDEYKGKHIGANLMRFVEAGAIESGYTVLFLQTRPVLDDAIKLYEHLGYTKEIKPGQYAAKPDAVCLAKVIYPKERQLAEGLGPTPPLPKKIARHIPPGSVR